MGFVLKKQPLLSENPLSEDLKIAQSRCHAVCVTQAATGEETHYLHDQIGSQTLIGVN